MTGEETLSQQNSGGEQAQFNLGISKNAGKGQKPRTIEEVTEQRRQEMFSGNFVESNKRQREDYAVKLRKAER